MFLSVGDARYNNDGKKPFRADRGGFFMPKTERRDIDMSARSYQRGHPIIWRDGQWVYEDDDSPIVEERPCARCGEMPTVEGYDVCLGHIEGVSSVCCGHGVERPYAIRPDGIEPVVIPIRR